MRQDNFRFKSMLPGNRWRYLDTKVTILSRMRTNQDIFFYETVFEKM